jgi:hypothetical protein
VEHGVARYLKEHVSQKKDARSEAKRGGPKPNISVHLQGGIAHVYTI